MNVCTRCTTSFSLLPEEKEYLEKHDLPEPEDCPECRLKRRLLERNARKLYYRQCDTTGKAIISMYHPEQPFPVYDEAIWWGDSWDPMDYGRDYDFDQPFFEQMHELSSEVPHMSVFIVSDSRENSEFTNCVGFLKNCYLLSESDYDEDCMYCNRIYHSKDLIDCTNCYESELCYECIDCIKGHGLLYSIECENCAESYFLQNCIGCIDCIGCVNQRHKQYMMFNRQYSRDDYEKELKALRLDTYTGRKALHERAHEFFITQPRKAIIGEHNENVIGDHVYNSKNAHY